jgi:hypothetical protein
MCELTVGTIRCCWQEAFFVQKSLPRLLSVGEAIMRQTARLSGEQIEAMKSEVFELGLFRLRARRTGLTPGCSRARGTRKRFCGPLPGCGLKTCAVGTSISGRRVNTT